jgi:ABC-2 type transport system ATP-binding protein
MITVKSLRIDYDDLMAVCDLDLEVKPGQIFGLVGPNGAGKTSTIKALAGILEPTYGEIKIAGYDLDIDTQKALQLTGFMPDYPSLYENLKVWEYLDVFAAAYLIPRKERLGKVKFWVEKVNLSGKWDAFIRDLSRGMRQRLVLAKTLLPGPKVLLLDEPASGLDPIARREFRDLLKHVALEGEGMAILISSHILTELSDFCNAIGIMEKGRMVISGTLEDIRSSMKEQRLLIIRLTADDSMMKDSLKNSLQASRAILDIRESSPGIFQAHFTGDRPEAAVLLAGLIAKQIPVSDFYMKEADVEDIFFKIGAKEVS